MTADVFYNIYPVLVNPRVMVKLQLIKKNTILILCSKQLLSVALCFCMYNALCISCGYIKKGFTSLTAFNKFCYKIFFFKITVCLTITHLSSVFLFFAHSLILFLEDIYET